MRNTGGDHLPQFITVNLATVIRVMQTEGKMQALALSAINEGAHKAHEFRKFDGTAAVIINHDEQPVGVIIIPQFQGTGELIPVNNPVLTRD